jgi:hypothetical protein
MFASDAGRVPTKCPSSARKLLQRPARHPSPAKGRRVVRRLCQVLCGKGKACVDRINLQASDVSPSPPYTRNISTPAAEQREKGGAVSEHFKASDCATTHTSMGPAGTGCRCSGPTRSLQSRGKGEDQEDRWQQSSMRPLGRGGRGQSDETGHAVFG